LNCFVLLLTEVKIVASLSVAAKARELFPKDTPSDLPGVSFGMASPHTGM
jgi:hypothetical protein